MKIQTTFQNLQDTAKADLRRKFVVTQAYHKKQEKSQISNLSFHLKELGGKKVKVQSKKERNNRDQSITKRTEKKNSNRYL